jgi:hypothetical protein
MLQDTNSQLRKLLGNIRGSSRFFRSKAQALLFLVGTIDDFFKREN